MARVERVGIARIHHQVDRAGARAPIQHLLPCPPAVGGFEYAAILVVGPLVTGGRDVHDVRVGRVHDDARDGLRVGEAEMGEGAAGVGGFVDADARHRRAKDVGLAGADPQHVGVRWCDGEIADAGGRVVIED